MATPTELFINSELPKRPYTNQFPLDAGHVPVADGNGLQTTFRALDVADVANAASESYVDTAISNLVDSAPGTLDTLNELAAALGDDENFSSTVATSLGNRLRVDVNDQGLTLTQKQNGLDNLGITEVITDASINSSGLITFAKNTGQSSDTVQIPTAISGLSFDANTGILTSSYTNDAANTTLTVSATEVSDNVFRIKDNDDATKKIAFEASGIATGQTRTITMPDVDVDLGAIGVTKVYTAGVPYRVGELVYHQNKTWRVLIAHTGAIPFVNGNLSLVGDVLDVTLLTGYTYTAQRLGALVPYLNAVDKTLVITITMSSDVTIDISEAPLRVIILNRYPTLNKKVTITKTHASDAVQFLNDSGVNITTTAVGLTSTYDIKLAPGGELEITSSGDYQVVVSLRKQNAIGRFKLSDPSGTLAADRDRGWLFNGSATGARTITLPDANVNLGNVAQAASTSATGYLTSTDWNTFNSKLSLSDLRYNFVSYTNSTPYTIPASAVTEVGRTIIELSSPLLTNIYVSNTTSAAKSIGDSVHVSVTGAITAPVTLGGSGATLEGDPIFSFQHQTKTLIYKGSNVWKIIG